MLYQTSNRSSSSHNRRIVVFHVTNLTCKLRLGHTISWRTGDAFSVMFGGGGVLFEFISMLSSPSYKFRTKFALSNVNCSVAVLLRGSSIQQCHLTNRT